MTIKRDREIETLNERIKELEEEVFKKDNSLQQFRKEIVEKDKIIEEKTSLLEEKCRAYEEVSAEAEKRKKQVDQLRLSVKSRDEALTDLNNKNRSLLAQVIIVKAFYKVFIWSSTYIYFLQFESNYTKRSTSPGSQSTFLEESQNFRKTFNMCSPIRSHNSSLDLEPSTERSKTIFELHNSLEKRDLQELKKVSSIYLMDKFN